MEQIGILDGLCDGVHFLLRRMRGRGNVFTFLYVYRVVHTGRFHTVGLHAVSLSEQGTPWVIPFVQGSPYSDPPCHVLWSTMHKAPYSDSPSHHTAGPKNDNTAVGTVIAVMQGECRAILIIARNNLLNSHWILSLKAQMTVPIILK